MLRLRVKGLRCYSLPELRSRPGAQLFRDGWWLMRVGWFYAGYSPIAFLLLCSLLLAAFVGRGHQTAAVVALFCMAALIFVIAYVRVLLGFALVDQRAQTVTVRNP